MSTHRVIVLGLIFSAGCRSPGHHVSVGLQIDQARQASGYSNHSDNDLELSVTVTNHGGASIVLTPALFQLQLTDGALLSSDVLTDYRWISPSWPINAVELVGGEGISGFPLAFDVTGANAMTLVLTVASGDEPVDTDHLETVSTPLLTIDPCTPCGALCAYLEIETGFCCDGPPPAGGSCVNHVGTCPSDLALCSGSCVDLTQDDANCGACGVPAPNGGSCDGGTPSCDDGLTNCESQCTDVSADSANCGSCGKACPGSIQCRNGVCDSAVKFPITPAQSCTDACASIGATCSDSGGFACGYVDLDLVGVNGACGEMAGDDYDNTGIPGGGGSSGVDWHGTTCSAVASGLEDHFECHCVASP